MDARAREHRARGGAEDGDGDARVETRRGGAIGGADGTNGKAHPERAPAYLAVGGSSQEGIYGVGGWGQGLGIVESGAMDARGTPRESQPRSQPLAGFDNRRRDGRVASGSTPTLDASAPSALRLSSQNVARAHRISPEMAPVSRDADLETPMSRDAFVSVERRVRALESTRDEEARDVQRLKSMITDIMTTQANLLAALASRPPTFVVPPERFDDRPRRSRSPSADAKSASPHPRADDARKRPRAGSPRVDADVDDASAADSSFAACSSTSAAPPSTPTTRLPPIADDPTRPDSTHRTSHERHTARFRRPFEDPSSVVVVRVASLSRSHASRRARRRARRPRARARRHR